MATRLAWVLRAVAAGMVLLVGPVHADDWSSPRSGASPVPPSRDASVHGLNLSIRAQTLGIIDVPLAAPDRLGLEPATAPTGAGTTRMPQARTELRPGVYISVSPACLPGEDFPLPSRRRATPTRR